MDSVKYFARSISDNNRSSQNWVQDYEKVLKRGIKDIKEDAQKRLTEIRAWDKMTKGIFLEACIC